MIDFKKNILFDFKLKDIDVKIHVSALGMILLSAVQLNSLRAAVISFIGFLLIIMVHELGHAFFVKLFKHKVYSVVIYFLGGQCEHSMIFHRKETFWIAAGGVIFQLILLLVSLSGRALLNFYKIPVNSYIDYFLVNKLVFTNLFIICFNLIPLKGFDGYRIFESVRTGSRNSKFKTRIYPFKKKKVVTDIELADSLLEARRIFYKARGEEE